MLGGKSQAGEHLLQDSICAKFKMPNSKQAQLISAVTAKWNRKGLLGCWKQAVTRVCSFCDTSLICTLMIRAHFCMYIISQKQRNEQRTNQGTPSEATEEN